MRNPSYFRDDVRAFRAVEPPEAMLQHACYGNQLPRDVMFLSTQAVELAGGRFVCPAFPMSGGDEDGDDAVVLWDEELVGDLGPETNGDHSAHGPELTPDQRAAPRAFRPTTARRTSPACCTRRSSRCARRRATLAGSSRGCGASMCGLAIRSRSRPHMCSSSRARRLRKLTTRTSHSFHGCSPCGRLTRRRRRARSCATPTRCCGRCSRRTRATGDRTWAARWTRSCSTRPRSCNSTPCGRGT